MAQQNALLVKFVHSNRSLLIQEVFYCLNRVHRVMTALQQRIDEFEEEWNEYASSIVYVTSSVVAFAASSIPEAKEKLLEIAIDIQRTYLKSAKPDSEWTSTIEAVSGIDAIESKIAHELPGEWRQAAGRTEDIKEWVDRDKRQKPKVQARWDELIRIVMFQMLLPRGAEENKKVFKYVVHTCLNDMPFNRDWRKSPRSTTITTSTESRMYVPTHIVLSGTDFGNRAFPAGWITADEQKRLHNIMGAWLISFVTSKNHRQIIAHNKEVIVEIAAALLLLGVELEDKVVAAIEGLMQDLTKTAPKAEKKLRNAPPFARRSAYVEAITNDLMDGEKGGLYADYHTHVLVALLFIAALRHAGPPPPA